MRRGAGTTLHAVYNFSDDEKLVWMPQEGCYRNLVTGTEDTFQTFTLPGWGFAWFEER